MATKVTVLGKSTIKGNYETVDDSLRLEGGEGRGGRRPSQLTLDLLAGLTKKVPPEVFLPDKTIKAYGFRLRYYTDAEGYRVCWIEEEASE